MRALQLHPDKQQLQSPPAGESVAQEESLESRLEKFQLLQQAYEVLSNDTERRLYDEFRLSGMRVAFDRWKVMKAQGHVMLPLHI